MIVRTKLIEVEVTRDALYFGVGKDNGGGRRSAVFLDFSGQGLHCLEVAGRQLAGPGRN